MRFLLVAGIALLLLTISGCKGGGQYDTQSSGGASTPGTDPKASPNVSQTTAAGFKKDVEPIFSSVCARPSCHGEAKSGDMQLSPGMAYANTVNVKSSEVPELMRILPGDPDKSYLVMKIEGRQTVGMRMPLTGDPLSEKQIQAIRGWIQAGAKND